MSEHFGIKTKKVISSKDETVSDLKPKVKKQSKKSDYDKLKAMERENLKPHKA